MAVQPIPHIESATGGKAVWQPITQFFSSPWTPGDCRPIKRPSSPLAVQVNMQNIAWLVFRVKTHQRALTRRDKQLVWLLLKNPLPWNPLNCCLTNWVARWMLPDSIWWISIDLLAKGSGFRICGLQRTHTSYHVAVTPMKLQDASANQNTKRTKVFFLSFSGFFFTTLVFMWGYVANPKTTIEERPPGAVFIASNQSRLDFPLSTLSSLHTRATWHSSLPCCLLLFLFCPWGKLGRVQGLQIMTQTRSSVTSRLDSVFDGSAAPVTTSPHHSPVKNLKFAHRRLSLSQASEWMEDHGERIT